MKISTFANSDFIKVENDADNLKESIILQEFYNFLKEINFNVEFKMSLNNSL